jgi:hypothetical protein
MNAISYTAPALPGFTNDWSDVAKGASNAGRYSGVVADLLRHACGMSEFTFRNPIT